MINTMYDELGPVMGEIEADMTILESMILNGKSQKANHCLREAIVELRHALSDMSAAEFEIMTTPCEDF